MYAINKCHKTNDRGSHKKDGVKMFTKEHGYRFNNKIALIN